MASAHEGRRSPRRERPPRPQLHQAGEERPGALLAYPAREPPATACIIPAELLLFTDAAVAGYPRAPTVPIGDGNG
jgi:hypothetical protein